MLGSRLGVIKIQPKFGQFVSGGNVSSSLSPLKETGLLTKIPSRFSTSNRFSWTFDQQRTSLMKNENSKVVPSRFFSSFFGMQKGSSQVSVSSLFSAKNKLAVIHSRGIKSLPPMKYGFNRGFRPVIGVKALEIHYYDILAKQVKYYNQLVTGTKYQTVTLESVIMQTCGNSTDAAIFNVANEIWNHLFFFDALKPGGTMPSPQLKELIEINFESWENFIKSWQEMAVSMFGNGWIWMVYHKGSLDLMVTQQGTTPLLFGPEHIPILGLDMWEHSYVIDHFMDVEGYVEKFLHGVDWEVVEHRLGEAERAKREKSIV